MLAKKGPMQRRADSHGGVTYVDRPETSAVASSHVLVQRLDGRGSRQLTVLLVHVVGA